MELIDLEIIFPRLYFFLTQLQAEVVPGTGDEKTGFRSYDVAGSVFDDVISKMSGSSEAGKIGPLAGVDLEIVRKIQIL